MLSIHLSKKCSTPNSECLHTKKVQIRQRKSGPDVVDKCGNSQHNPSLYKHEYIRAFDVLACCFKTSILHTKYCQLQGPHAIMYSDTLFSKVVSLCGNICGQIFTNS